MSVSKNYFTKPCRSCLSLMDALSFSACRHGSRRCYRVVSSYKQNGALTKIARLTSSMQSFSENTPTGRKATKLNQTLLNGNNICMVRHNSLTSHLNMLNPHQLAYCSSYHPAHSRFRGPWRLRPAATAKDKVPISVTLAAISVTVSASLENTHAITHTYTSTPD